MKAVPLFLASSLALSSPAPLRAQPQGPPLVVLAAASLSDVLPKVAQAWTAKSGVPVAFSFDATSRLAEQVKEGAPADAFFSADEDWMDFLQKNGRIVPATRRNVLSNELVAIQRRGLKPRLSTARDLLAPGIRHVALAGANVPAGMYAEAALKSAGVWPQVEAKVVRAENVRVALEWVAEGQAEAGIVYATDAKAERRVRKAFEFPENSHPPILYPAAVLTGSKQADAAKAFLDFCSRPKARALFKKAGFGIPTP